MATPLPLDPDTIAKIHNDLDIITRKAWRDLSKYDFSAFSYHAQAFTLRNGLLPLAARLPNPFRDLVLIAKKKASDGSPAKNAGPVQTLALDLPSDVMI